MQAAVPETGGTYCCCCCCCVFVRSICGGFTELWACAGTMDAVLFLEVHSQALPSLAQTQPLETTEGTRRHLLWHVLPLVESRPDSCGKLPRKWQQTLIRCVRLA